MPVGGRAQLLGGEPHRAHDALIERTIGLFTQRLAAERETQIRDIAPRSREVRHIGADERLGLESMRRFFERLADYRFDERFARFEVTGRLVDPQTCGRVLFDDEKAPVSLDDRRHRNVGGPSI